MRSPTLNNRFLATLALTALGLCVTMDDAYT